MHHRFSNVWTLGRFRLSVTRGAKPIGLSVPEDFRAILATAPDVRTEAQKNLLTTYFRAVDPVLRSKIDALNASRAPLPVDPRLQELRASSSSRSGRSSPTRRWSSSGATWK